VGGLVYGRVGVRWTPLPHGTYGTKWDICAGFHESHRRHFANRANNYPVQTAFAVQCHANTPRRRYAHSFPSWLLDPSSYLLRRADSDALVLA